MPDVFHLGLTREMLDGATLAIIPGDPGRVEKIANHLDNPTALASTREYTSFRGYSDGHAIVVCSTGIGGPSVSIAVEELAQLGVTTFIRVGTTGAIQPHIKVKDVVITTAAVRLDGASFHFAPPEFPAVSDFGVTRALVDATKAAGQTPHVGVTASSDTFYPGQERYDTVAGRVIDRFRGSLQEWQDLGVLNYEMESATLFTQCVTQGLRAGCIAGVLVNRADQEIPDDETHAAVESNAVSIAVAAACQLVANTVA